MRRCDLPCSDASHFSCHRWRLSCLMIFFSSSCSPRMLRCSYSCFLSTASILIDIRHAMIHTASSDTIRKALDTLRALSRLLLPSFCLCVDISESWGILPEGHMPVSKSPLKLKVSFEVDEVPLCLTWASLMHWPLKLPWLQRIVHEP